VSANTAHILSMIQHVAAMTIGDGTDTLSSTALVDFIDHGVLSNLVAGRTI
jgi:hypothetical protein